MLKGYRGFGVGLGRKLKGSKDRLFPAQFRPLASHGGVRPSPRRVHPHGGVSQRFGAVLRRSRGTSSGYDAAVARGDQPGKEENKSARTENVSFELNDKVRKVNVEVVPHKNSKERCFLVSIEEPGKQSDVVSPLEPHGGSLQNARPVTKKDKADHVASLERELIETRNYLQSVQEQHEVAAEELQASREESQSANEELQSINEEMETSKEELESTNEELTTVNEEMLNRNTELNRLNSDLTNLQGSTKLVIVLLGRDLTLRRFSKQAETQFNLLPTDVGRPWGNIRHNLDHSDLESFIAEVITSVRACECEVCDKQGRWHDMHVRPYLTIDNKVDGAVLVLMDITARKRTERDLSGKAFGYYLVGRTKSLQ